MQTNECYARYEKEIAAPRSIFNNQIKAFLNETEPRNLLIFWINFSAFGVGMTEPVEDWIKRAGQRSCELGYKALGEKLIKHARHEKDHHLMMIKDTHNLVEMWNKCYSPKLDANKLFKRKFISSVLAYQKLHEDCINSKFPFAQIAIEYEIERLAISHGSQIIENAVSVLGDQIKFCLTFVFDHVEIDQAHTVYNREALEAFVKEYPETVDKLIETGASALKIYANFLNACHEYTESFETEALMA